VNTTNVPSNTASSPALAAASPIGSRRNLAFAAALAGAAGILAIFGEATMAMVSTWSESNTFNHGPLIPLLSAYMIWRRRDRLADAEPRFEWAGLIALFLALAVWTVGRISATMVIQQFALVFTLQAFVFCVLGRDVTARILFPLFYLLFAVPFGAELVPPLQDVTAFFVVVFLRLTGIPVFIDGVFIATPAGNYLVAEACAGLRYLISTLAISLVFANLAFHSWRRRAAFIALALVVPIIANGIRAFLIVLIAYISDNEIATGVDHVLYGWVFFSFVTFLLFAIGYAMRDSVEDELPARPPAPGGRAGAAPIVAAAIAVTLVFGTYKYVEVVTNAAARIDLARAAAPAMPGFERIAARGEAWKPRFAGADHQIDQAYRKGGRDIDLHIGLYTRERQGAKAITSAHNFAPEEPWQLGELASIRLPLDDRELTATSVRLSAPGRYRLVWYWYWVNGEFTGNPYAAKLLRMKALLTGGSPATGIVAISGEYPPALGEPTQLFRDAMAALPALQATIEGAVRH
jgi:exosortase A